MKKIVCSLLIMVLSFGFMGCDKGYQKYKDYSFEYFDTATTIIGFEKDEAVFKANCEKIKELLGEYHRLYTIYNRYDGINNLYAVNRSSEALTVDAEIIDLLEFSDKMHALTKGKVNVAMGSVLSLWHDYREKGLNDPSAAQLPPMDLLMAAEKHTDIEDIAIDGNTISKKDSEIKLDVGAVAKGYATEKVALWMQDEGITGYLLNVGGNIRIVGDRPDGEKWQIGLENPDTENTEEPYIEYLELSDGYSVVTSGSYQRFYTVEGKNYHHIIDSDTLMPADKYKMVSVINKNSGVADALSTALFCMDYNEGKQLVNSLENTYAVWVGKDGKITYSKGFKDFIK